MTEWPKEIIVFSKLLSGAAVGFTCFVLNGWKIDLNWLLSAASLNLAFAVVTTTLRGRSN